MDNEKTTFEEELRKSGVIAYTNVGVSMLPLIKENKDALIIRKVEPESLKRYDIVLFKRENVKGRGRYVLHRIIKPLKDGKYFIVGDNCTDGETVDKEQILGVLTEIVRADKKVELRGFCYKAYLYLWCAPYHMRFLILKAKNFIRYVAGAVIYKLKKHIFRVHGENLRK